MDEDLDEGWLHLLPRGLEELLLRLEYSVAVKHWLSRWAAFQFPAQSVSKSSLASSCAIASFHSCG